LITVSSPEDLAGVLQTQDAAVLFTAPSWCIPCRRLKPSWEAAEADAAVPFVVVDIDNNPWAIEQYSIQSVPTILLIGSNDVVEIRARKSAEIVEEINAASV
jgi:thiol-disulfide isomerase/thioredoxin